MSDLAQPVRVALTGKTVSPGIFEVLLLLGRDISLARIAEAHSEIRKAQALTSQGSSPSLGKDHS
jgi:hypothetical protein